MRVWGPLARSAGFLLVAFLVAAGGARLEAAIPAAERQALIDLYNSTNGADWTTSTNWLGAAGTECTWHGVTCNATETSVEMLLLASNHLVGPLPASLGNLSALRVLYLYSNQISGTLPPELGGLTSLETLILYSNQITGAIPPEMGNLTNLDDFHAYSNQLSGSIPAELGNLTSLGSLVLHTNQLTGPIPAELGNLTALQSLHLHTNQLSGAIPPELGALANLQHLHLYSNQLSGPIPPEFGNLSSLRYLTLSNNQLSGPIPTQLGSLANLVELQLVGNQLSGSIPTSLGDLTNLQRLYLSWNRLSGHVPAALGNLTNLQWLQLARNRLSGALPTELANLVSLGTGYLDLRWNALHSDDAALIAFLNSRQNGGDWQSTQTIAPADVAAGSPTTASLTATWTPILYTADTGRYTLFVRRAGAGPFFLSGSTSNKSAASLEISGLDSATSYEVVARTTTDPHANNANTVISELSSTASGTTSGWMSPSVTSADDVAGGASDLNGVLEPGESVVLAPSWTNTDAAAHAVTGTLSGFTGPAGADYTLVDGGADYGTVDPAATADCHDATGDCYQFAVSDPATRPALHWDATVDETLSTGEVKTWTIHVGDSFTDAPPGSFGYAFVETLLHSGITAGCGGTQYCPSATLTRWQMAVFLTKALAGDLVSAIGEVPGLGGYDCTANGVSQFADVPPEDPGCTHIHYIAAEGITAGCGGGNYCPAATLTRWQMAVFLAKAMTGGTVPASGNVPGMGDYNCVPAGTSVFYDVLPDDPGCPFIHYIAAQAVTAGCGGGNYCPADPLTRAQMAVFLTKAFDLNLYGP
ncbi:MAG: leucine-rich repeat domain-containing protein [Acidobacteriota bacterium]